METMEALSFEITEKKLIPSQEGTLTRAVSRVHGTELIHLSCSEEPENSFALCFKTPCENDQGIPHIIEHMVLQGSGNYPVKDLYIELDKRCMATYAYGTTGSNRTVYMCSCLNAKQYGKLVSVFLDGLFNPLLKEEVFLQEGWRLEFEEPDNPESRLIRSGSVYNEMKGVVLDQYRYVSEFCRNVLYPDSSFGKKDGGDFRFIPKVSYREVTDYHRKHYTPSNCCFVAITPIPFNEIALQLDNELFGLVPTDQPVRFSPQMPFSQPGNISVPMPGKAEDRCIALSAWVVPGGKDAVSNLSWLLLKEILCDYDHSPLKKALTRPGYGTSLFTSFNKGFKQNDLSIGLYGVAEVQADDVRELLRKELQNLADNGLDSRLVESVISLNELRSREKGAYWSERMLWKLSAAWTLGEELGMVADSTSMFDSLRSRLTHNPDLFSEMIREHLLKNSHRIDGTFYPDNESFIELSKKERRELDQLGESLSEEEKKHLIAKYGRLQQYLDKPVNSNDLAKLPIPDLSDLKDFDPGSFSFHKEETESGLILSTGVNTSGICYTDLCFNVTGLSGEMLAHLSLYADILKKTTSEHYPNEDSCEGGDRFPLGISVSANAIQSVSSPDKFNTVLKISGRCLPEKLSLMLSTMENIAFKPFSQSSERILATVRELWNNRRGDIDYWGTDYSLLMARSGLSTAGYVSNLLKGIPSLRLLTLTDETMMVKTSETLSYIGDYTFCHAPRILAWSGPDEKLHEARKWFGTLPGRSEKQPETHVEHFCFPGSFGIETGNAMSSAGMTLKPIPRYHSLAASGAIAMEMIDEFIISEIMLKGGVYASGGYMENGEILFYSYRDPSPARSLTVFRKAIENCNAITKSKKDRLKDYILSAVKKANPIQRPATANQSAIRKHFTGEDPAFTSKWNQALLKVTFDSVAEFCSILRDSSSESGICVIGNAETLNSMNLDKRIKI